MTTTLAITIGCLVVSVLNAFMSLSIKNAAANIQRDLTKELTRVEKDSTAEVRRVEEEAHELVHKLRGEIAAQITRIELALANFDKSLIEKLNGRYATNKDYIQMLAQRDQFHIDTGKNFSEVNSRLAATAVTIEVSLNKIRDSIEGINARIRER